MLTGAGTESKPLTKISTAGEDSTKGTGSKSLFMLAVGRGGMLLPSVCASRASVPPYRVISERMASTAASVAACGETGLAACSVALSPAELLSLEASCGCGEYDGLGPGEANVRAACAAGVVKTPVVMELAACICVWLVTWPECSPTHGYANQISTACVFLSLLWGAMSNGKVGGGEEEGVVERTPMDVCVDCSTEAHSCF